MKRTKITSILLTVGETDTLKKGLVRSIGSQSGGKSTKTGKEKKKPLANRLGERSMTARRDLKHAWVLSTYLMNAQTKHQ